MRFNRISRVSMLLGSVAALALPAVVHAEEAESDENEIVVTATRDSRTLKDVSMSVSVVTGEQLQKLNILDAKDVQQLSPGLELSNNSGRNNTATLRGISFDPDQGTSPSVQVYLNESPVDAQTAFTALYDIGQIEVLRGPQGLLRGVSAPAGSITIATRRPNFEKAEGYVQGLGGTEGSYNFQGGVSVPLGGGFAVRAAGLIDGNRLNHVRNVNRGNERSDSKTYSGRLTLGWKPNDQIEAYLTYQHLEMDNNQFQQVVGAGNTPIGHYEELFGTPINFLPASFGGRPFNPTTTRSGPALTARDRGAVSDGVYTVKLNSDIVNFQLGWDFGAVRMDVVANYQRDKVDTLRDQDLGNAIPGFQSLNPVHVPYNVTSQEVRFSSTAEEGFGWGVGFFHSRQTGMVTNNSTPNLFWYNVEPNANVLLPAAVFGLPTPPNFVPGGANMAPLNVFVDVPLNIETFSYNATLRYFSGPLKIEGGIRYTTRKNVQTTQIGFSGIQNRTKSEVIPAALQDVRSKPWTGGLTINYAASDTLNVYAAYGHAARAGSTGVSLPIGISNDLVRTRDEKSDSFEVGFKGSTADRKVNFTVDAFYQNLKGYIRRFDGIYYDRTLSTPANGFFSFNYNGDAKIKGVEATIDARPLTNWDLGIQASYTHARYSNAPLPCNDYAGTGVPNQTGTRKVTGTGNVSYCKSNGRLSESPDFSLTANTEVRFPMGSVTPFIRANWQHRTGFFSDLSQYTYEGRDLVNLFVGLRSSESGWEVNAFARNLFNQQKITNISLGNAQIAAAVSGTYDSGYRLVNTMAPREFGLTARMTF